MSVMANALTGACLCKAKNGGHLRDIIFKASATKLQSRCICYQKA